VLLIKDTFRLKIVYPNPILTEVKKLSLDRT